MDYRYRHWGSVFNAYTGTPFQKTYRSPVHLVLILRAISQGTPTAQLTDSGAIASTYPRSGTDCRGGRWNLKVPSLGTKFVTFKFSEMSGH
ncbi:unnamed protein product [Gemmata massiliana]|uniref:Uncharacterized protein n=1 Tax=Gemmata massiliana TaxID=1210884 RepID=A0A6P2DJC2_9BACT|nr:hypothetical protein [Gemmata massiliana]VTS01675.1 unnamed protein product [Gemmata massiliana]